MIARYFLFLGEGLKVKRLTPFSFPSPFPPANIPSHSFPGFPSPKDVVFHFDAGVVDGASLPTRTVDNSIQQNSLKASSSISSALKTSASASNAFVDEDSFVDSHSSRPRSSTVSFSLTTTPPPFSSSSSSSSFSSSSTLTVPLIGHEERPPLLAHGNVLSYYRCIFFPSASSAYFSFSPFFPLPFLFFNFFFLSSYFYVFFPSIFLLFFCLSR